jgi:hypothetical protein
MAPDAPIDAPADGQAIPRSAIPDRVLQRHAGNATERANDAGLEPSAPIAPGPKIPWMYR